MTLSKIEKNKEIHLKKPHVKLEKDNAVVELVQQLRAYMIQHDLQLGDTLPSEREIAEKFSYARNTVREALGVLKAYGVMQIKRKVGAVIVNLHFDAAMNLFSFQLKISEESFKDIQSFRKLIAIGIYD